MADHCPNRAITTSRHWRWMEAMLVEGTTDQGGPWRARYRPAALAAALVGAP